MNATKRRAIYETLRSLNPHPTTELEYSTPFELLIAVMLSAQATDVSVNKAMRRMFPVANTPSQVLALGEAGVTDYIKTIGLYKTKAKNVIATCRILLEQHAGEVPADREALEALPGVGRKTANVVLNTAFGHPTIAVDTHIFRVANRTGLAPGKDVRAVEIALEKFNAGGIPAGCASLADPARPLRLQGAPARMLALRDRTALRFQAQDAGAARMRPARCAPAGHRVVQSASRRSDLAAPRAD